MNNGGKGSKPRPFSVSSEEYANRWDAIFGRDLKETSDSVLTEEGSTELSDMIETSKFLKEEKR